MKWLASFIRFIPEGTNPQVVSHPHSFRDSTQIVLPAGAIDGLREELEAEFTVTLAEDDGRVRLIGSPVVISDVSGWLIRHGVSVP